MPNFIEYRYDHYGLGEERERDIRPIGIFNVKTVDIPAGAIGFSFLKATDLEHAKNRESTNNRTYYLSSKNEIWTIDRIRDSADAVTEYYEGAHERLRKAFGELDETSEDQDNEDITENTNKIEDTESPDNMKQEKPLGIGDIITNDLIRMMKEHGWYRALGHIIGGLRSIQDQDVVIDRHDRSVISPALKPPSIG